MEPRKVALVVEDDPMIRSLVRTLLEDEFEVLEAENGMRALVKTWDAQPDIIVLDRDMPVMRGDEAAPYLRVLAPGTFIVAFSAALGERPFWADTFVAKGDMSSLLDVVRSRRDQIAV